MDIRMSQELKVRYDNALQALRLVAQGWSLSQASRALGISPSSICQISKNRYPFSDSLAKPPDFDAQALQLRRKIKKLRQMQAVQASAHPLRVS